MGLGAARNVIALDARVLGVLEAAGLLRRVPVGARDYEQVEDAVLRHVAQPLGLEGIVVDRTLYQRTVQVKAALTFTGLVILVVAAIVLSSRSRPTRISTGSTKCAGAEGQKPPRCEWRMVNGSFVPGPCALLDIGGVDVHRDAMHPNPRVPQSAFSHGSHGFEVVRMGGSNDDYTAGLHTWVNAFSGIHARVVYKLAEPIGGTCAFNGIEGVP